MLDLCCLMVILNPENALKINDSWRRSVMDWSVLRPKAPPAGGVGPWRVVAASQQISGSVFTVNLCPVVVFFFGSRLSARVFLPLTHAFVLPRRPWREKMTGFFRAPLCFERLFLWDWSGRTLCWTEQRLGCDSLSLHADFRTMWLKTSSFLDEKSVYCSILNIYPLFWGADDRSVSTPKKRFAFLNFREVPLIPLGLINKKRR